VRFVADHEDVAAVLDAEPSLHVFVSGAAFALRATARQGGCVLPLLDETPGTDDEAPLEIATRDELFINKDARPFVIARSSPPRDRRAKTGRR
jgi:hypothetical protein